jgi:hypothetical protein
MASSSHLYVGSTIIANKAFGVYQNKQSYLDYLKNKTGTIITNSCKTKNLVNSQGNKLLFKDIKALNCVANCSRLPFDKTQLQVNLITQLDMNNVTLLELKTNPGVPCVINPSNVPINSFYNVDPTGAINANNSCNTLHFTTYMVLNTPSVNPYLDALPLQKAGCQNNSTPSTAASNKNGTCLNCS